MKKFTQSYFLFALCIGLAHANPNAVIFSDAKMDQNGKIIQPDKLYLQDALNNYQKGFYKNSYKFFLKAAAFGNSKAFKYLGLMNIKAIGTKQNWAKGYAWIKLASNDQTKDHQELQMKIKNSLSNDELSLAEIEFNRLNSIYSEKETLERRKKWSRLQLKKLVGSNVGAQSVNSYSYKITSLDHDRNQFNGKLVSANNTEIKKELSSFVFEYDFGYSNQTSVGIVSSGEILPSPENNQNKN